jgi:hypothetical protein
VDVLDEFPAKALFEFPQDLGLGDLFELAVESCNPDFRTEKSGLGAALDLDLTMLREVFSQTGANSRVLETDGEEMQNREHSCFFSAAHAAKDSGIALELARNLGLNLPLARATKEQYDRMIVEALGDLDKSGIAELTFKDRHKRSGDRV